MNKLYDKYSTIKFCRPLNLFSINQSKSRILTIQRQVQRKGKMIEKGKKNCLHLNAYNFPKNGRNFRMHPETFNGKFGLVPVTYLTIHSCHRTPQMFRIFQGNVQNTIFLLLIYLCGMKL